MKIKQAAELTGLTEKNIRFYEQENLIHPRRVGTYRDYSEEDIRHLKEIKLLRRLGVSLKHIRLTMQGEISLRDCMELRHQEIQSELDALRDIDSVCQELLGMQTRLEGLPIDRYLQELDRRESLGQRFINILNDCKTRAKNIIPTPAFWFEPNEPILKPAEFTQELIDYCAAQGKSLEILHIGMEPVVYIDGKKYVYMLENPRMLEPKGLLRIFAPLFTIRTYGFRFVYAYPYQ